MLRSKSISFLLALAIPLAVAAVPVFASTAAFAEAPPAAAPAPATTVTARFQRYLLAPNGHPMGLMLADGTVVRTPGRAMHRDAVALQAGDTLQIEGVAVKTPTGVLLTRAIVRKDGVVVADASKQRGHRGHHGKDNEGKEHHGKEHHGKKHAALTPMSGAGKIAAVVSTPKGHVLAVVLDDGTTAMAKGLETFGLKVGDQVALAGMGGTYPRGKALRIEKITLPNGQTRDIPPPAPRRPEADKAPA